MIEYEPTPTSGLHRMFVKNEQYKHAISELLEKHPELESLKAVKVGRNDLCPCGSGKKFKKCCIVKVGADAEEVAI